MLKSLEELVNIIRDRKNSNPEKSYTSKLLNNKKMNVAKVNEEVKELIEAIQKNENQVHEAADVLYHLLVLLEGSGVKIEDVMQELKKDKMEYEKNNIFAKILRGEIPCKKVYEDEYVLAFHDINPQKKVHVLVVPKGEYVNLDDFSSKASEKEISGLIKGISVVAKKVGVSDEVNGGGYRSLVNIGENGGQEVPHLHFHIFGGEKVGKMVS